MAPGSFIMTDNILCSPFPSQLNKGPVLNLAIFSVLKMICQLLTFARIPHPT